MLSATKHNNKKNNETVKVLMFGHNRYDNLIIRRAEMFLAAGTQLTTLTFRRDGQLPAKDPKWDDIDLGTVEHARFAGRILVYLKALVRIGRYRKKVREADVITVRNLDLYILMMFSLFLYGPRKKSNTFKQTRIYEVIDVHFALTADGLRARFLRFLERIVLRHTDLVITTSPGFERGYLTPIQKYTGPILLIENKLPPQILNISRPVIQNRVPGAPLRINWVGNLRCPATFKALIECAQRNPDRIRLRISGRVSYFILHDFDEKIANIKNIEFTGVYNWPEGLADIYKDVDLCWSHDANKLTQNSGWLTPNRVYEAGYFSVPAIAIAGSETARFVERLDRGFLIKEPTADAMQLLIDNISDSDIDNARRRISKESNDQFVADPNHGFEVLEKCRRPLKQ